MPSKFEATFTRIVHNISKGALYAAAATVAPWTVLFTVYIFVRKTGVASWFFVEEYTQYWVVAVICLSFAYSLRVDDHVRIELLARYFPKKLGCIVEVLVTLLALVTVSIFVYYGIQQWVVAYGHRIRYFGGVESLLWPFYSGLIIGYGLLCLALLSHLYSSVIAATRCWRNGGD